MTPAAAPSAATAATPTAPTTPPAATPAAPTTPPAATPAAAPASSADPLKLAEELNSLIKVKIPDLTKRKAAWKCLTGLDSMKGAPVELLQGMIYGLKSGCKIGEDGVGAFMTTTDGEHILLPKSRVPVENQATPAPTGPVAVRPDGQLF
jgi:hypothetical protein